LVKDDDFMHLSILEESFLTVEAPYVNVFLLIKEILMTSVNIKMHWELNAEHT